MPYNPEHLIHDCGGIYIIVVVLTDVEVILSGTRDVLKGEKHQV